MDFKTSNGAQLLPENIVWYQIATFSVSLLVFISQLSASLDFSLQNQRETQTAASERERECGGEKERVCETLKLTVWRRIQCNRRNRNRN